MLVEFLNERLKALLLERESLRDRKKWKHLNTREYHFYRGEVAGEIESYQDLLYRITHPELLKKE